VSKERAATLRHAEQLAHQGRLEDGIAEYRRLIDEAPRDWNAANSLGDLLVKTGQVPEAVELFARAAEVLAADGFAARACALYKKILKLQPHADAALIRAGELSADQGLIADARRFFAVAADGRQTRGDARGALDVRVRMAALDPDDLQARIAGARARLAMDDVDGAVRDFTDLGLHMLERERGPEALTALEEVVALDPANTTVAYLVELLASGNVADAAAFVSSGAAPESLLSIDIDERPAVQPTPSGAAPLQVPAQPAADLEPLGVAPHAADVGEIPAVMSDEQLSAPAAITPDIEEVFARLRQDAATGTVEEARIAFMRGIALLDAGELTAGIEQLRLAARSPQQRFAAASRLARAYQARRQFSEAIDWLGHALDAPALQDEDRYETLLQLSTLLEQQGETARALAACLELQAHAGAYRDVDARIARLTRAQAGG
jgi:tetratricopeptide (TPR) repeat protein